MARDPVKISANLDDNSLTNEFFVGISDGTEQLLVNADGSLNATINNAAGASAVNIQDGGNSITVDDGGSSITVDATDLDIRNLSETTDQVLVFANTAADGTGTDLVPLVDASGHLQVDVLSGGGAGTEYTEDAAAPAAATGGTLLVERDDALSTITPIEGDWTKLYANARGALWVELDPTNTVSVDDNGGSLTIDNTTLAVVGGGTEAAALRVTIANDSTGLLSVDDNGGSLTIDNSTLAVVGGGTEATALRVTIANDSTGLVSVDDGGGSLTVDAVDLDIRALDHVTIGDSVRIGDGTETLAINTDGSINVVTQSSSGTAIANYDQVAALASSASDNHDYTAAGGTFEPTSVTVSGESIGTFDILANAVTIATLRTSVENPNAVYEFPDGFSIADTQVLRVTRTNDSNKAHSFESTINGYQN